MSNLKKFSPVLVGVALFASVTVAATSSVTGSVEPTLPQSISADGDVTEAVVLEDWEFTRSRRSRGCRFTIPATNP